ncbi:RNA-binding protein lark-like isoform X2 [Ptychodera flava]|uniref:RNA-binding protein lark-like isoform X2 n=1 Tax=Ptychodera flava TaxID=63121 RepID=UPI00396A47FC
MTKLFIGNLSKSVQSRDLRELFEKYGKVSECDVIKNYGFVHMIKENEAKEAMDALNSKEFMGTNIKVQMSTSRVHKTPGMGSKGECFKCGRQGHWSRDCPRGGGDRDRGRDRDRDRERDRYGPPLRDRYWDYPPPPRRELPPPDYDRDRMYDPYRRPPDYPDPYYRSRSRSPIGRRYPSPPPYSRRPMEPGFYERPPVPPRPRDPYLDFPPRRGPVTPEERWQMSSAVLNAPEMPRFANLGSM